MKLNITDFGCGGMHKKLHEYKAKGVQSIRVTRQKREHINRGMKQQEHQATGVSISRGMK
jgi:hypothetical protein